MNTATFRGFLVGGGQTTMFIGIDPGAGGAIAALENDGSRVTVIDMPTLDEEIGRTVRRRVNSALLAAELRRLAAEGSRLSAYVEKVNGMPRDGSGAAFTFGTSYGIVLGVLGALHVRYTLVPPAVWKKAIGCPADKGGARARAMQLFPDQAELFKRVRDDGRSEAAMIAYYGWQIEQRAAL